MSYFLISYSLNFNFLYLLKLHLLESYNKIKKNLLRYSFFSGLVLFFLVSLPIIFIGLNNQVVFLFYFIFFLFPIVSTWIYRSKVSFLDFKSAFTLSFFTLLIAILMYSIFIHFKGIRIFNFLQFVFSLTPLIAYSFLLAILLKKQN